MVKIAIAAASSQLAREVIDKLVATQRHEITALVRKDPAHLPSLDGLKWVQTSYDGKSELVQLFKGVHTVLCFIAELDPKGETQKRLIDAAVEAGVKRFAPSEWSTGVNLESCLDVMPWYAGKIEVARYLEDLNKEKKVIEYCRFQVGGFLDYLGYPRLRPKHILTIETQFNFESLHAVAIEDALDSERTYTFTEDIANVVTRAIEYEGEWPIVGGISGNRISVREILEIAKRVRGKPFDVDWLKLEDLEAGELKTDIYPRVDHPAIPKDQIEAFSKIATRGVLLASERGAWTSSDEWNQIFPDYKFLQVEDLIKKLWAEK